MNTSTLMGLVTLIRPKQWVKNTFVLAPLVFVGGAANLDMLLAAGLAFVLFCLAASSVYIVNDYQDIESDRNHPIKSLTRPLASGQVSKIGAIAALLVCYLGLGIGFLFLPEVVGVALVYILLNYFYSIWIKHQPVLDIFTIATGFVLRVYAGAVALDVPVSSWMFVTTLCLALFLASIKRRQELINSGSDGRKVLEHYTIPMVDNFALISSIGALLFYSLFVMTERPELVVSIPFVLFGFFRYWFIVESSGGGESPTDALLSDWQLLIVIMGWAGVCAWVIGL